MSDERITRTQLADVVASEGLDYAILHYYGRTVPVQDDGIREAWAKAYDALDALVLLLPDEGVADE